jgi:hypothetical protein
MLKLRRQRREEHVEWLRYVPELLFIPAAVAVLPAAYGVSLIIQHRWTLGIGVMVAWAALFAYGGWWLHRHRYCHIGVSALAGVAAVMVSAYWFGG